MHFGTVAFMTYLFQNKIKGTGAMNVKHYSVNYTHTNIHTFEREVRIKFRLQNGKVYQT